MTDNTGERIDGPQKPKELPLPSRPSFQRVADAIEKWANSSGLQKPK